MRKLLVAFALFSITASPAAAQTVAQPQAPALAAPKMVKKVVCERVEDDEIGSRTATRKKCRTIEVPKPAISSAPNSGGAASAPSTERGN